MENLTMTVKSSTEKSTFYYRWNELGFCGSACVCVCVCDGVKNCSCNMTIGQKKMKCFKRYATTADNICNELVLVNSLQLHCSTSKPIWATYNDLCISFGHWQLRQSFDKLRDNVWERKLSLVEVFFFATPTRKKTFNAMYCLRFFR